MGISFKPVGFKEAERELSDAGLEVMRESAGAMRDEAQRLAPVDTGALKNSITVEPRADGAVVSTGVEWAVYQEYGTGLFAESGQGRKTRWVYQRADGRWVTTHGNPPQPFMRPSMPAAEAQFQQSKRRRGL